MPALYSSMSRRNRSARSMRVGFFRTAASRRFSRFRSICLAAVRLLPANRERELFEVELVEVDERSGIPAGTDDVLLGADGPVEQLAD